MTASTNYPEPKINVVSSVGAQDVVTRKQLCQDLERLGLSAGDIVCVHSAASKIGYVIGGPRTILDALLDTVGPQGTIMMPTFTGDLSDPAKWRFPAIPPEIMDEVRSSMPGFNPDLSPSRGMGVLPELLRHRPGAVRSSHPQSSFTALGGKASEICGQHSLDYRFGPQSPLGALTAHGGKVLMLGSPWNTASFFYLVDFELPGRTEVTMASPVETESGVQWREYRDLSYTARGHEAIIHLLERGMATRGLVGRADSVLFEAKPALAETLTWCRP
jgi:aminoglycoside 3-N-acetyltransferase